MLRVVANGEPIQCKQGKKLKKKNIISPSPIGECVVWRKLIQRYGSAQYI